MSKADLVRHYRAQAVADYENPSPGIRKQARDFVKRCDVVLAMAEAFRGDP